MKKIKAWAIIDNGNKFKIPVCRMHSITQGGYKLYGFAIFRTREQAYDVLRKAKSESGETGKSKVVKIKLTLEQ